MQGQSGAHKAQMIIVKMSIAMVVGFLLVWTPYAIVALIGAFGSTDALNPEATTLPALLAKSFTCLNPILYIALNRQVSQPQKHMEYF